ncbi:MAG: PAS domain S-box protein [Desulfotignum sp.]|nr:PAS domain S-box protein [Desulfotignum sp.]MCF8089969.1 PAS domain S-box protein [Desulfotignum sp.]MCF8137038.1 PAS domain S-box protein [Desulfotignum sp.]
MDQCVNQRLAEMLGYPSEQIIGKRWLEMVPPEQQAIAQAAEARRAQGYTDRYEIFLRHKQCRELPVVIGAGPRFDKNSGEFIGTMGVVTDITERRQATSNSSVPLTVSWDMIRIHLSAGM